MIDRDDSKLNTLHPEIDELFKKMGGAPRLPIPSVSAVKSFRQSYNKLVSRYNASQLAVSSLPPKPTWTEVDRHVPVRDSTTIAIRAYIPSDADGPLALGIMLHGGGWFMGNLETEQFMCRLLCARLNLVTVNVDFRLYPDVDFPVPITDCYDVVQWLSMHASELDDRIDLTKGFIVGGSSGGGTYASIACHLARDESMKPPLTGCYLACPILGDRVVRESGPIHDTSIFGSDRNKSDEQHANAPITNRETQQAIKAFANFEYGSPLLSPFFFESHDRLPRTYTQVCGIDPWRDPGIIYHEELEKVDQEVKIDVYKGMLHCWWTSFPMLKMTRVWLEDTVRGWEWLLRRSDKAEVARVATASKL